MKYANLRTPELIDKCVAKDALAWAEFITRYSGLITFSIHKVFSQYPSLASARAEDVKDIRQEIFSSLWTGNKLEEVRQKDSIDYWLVVMARNAALNHARPRRNEFLVGEESYFDSLKKEERAPEELQEKRDLKAEIKAMYKTLSTREKLVFKLHFKKRCSQNDIAAIIRVPVGTVSSIISRMRKKMKK